MSNLFKIILMDKKEDITSFSSLYDIKKEYKTSKVGHAGTLDKFASGLMICLIGGATKLNPIFSSFDKRYRASLKFGEETDTLDLTGNVIKKTSHIPTKEEIENILPSFMGNQKQVPPVYSAIHIGGKRAYIEARNNKNVEMEERDIYVENISLVSFKNGEAELDMRVSKGTYVRSLGRDIALKLGSFGHITKLKRTEIGPFTLCDIPLDTDALLEKTDLFGKVYFPSKYRRIIENGTIKREWIIKEEGENKKYKYVYIDDLLFGYAIDDDKIKIMARV